MANIVIDSKTYGDTTELILDGRLDVRAAKEAEEVFAEAAATSPNIVLEMSNLVYVASGGLRAIKRLKKLVSANGGTLVLRNVCEDVMEIFDMTGFTAMLTFE